MKISESDIRKFIREKIKHLVMDDALFKHKNLDGLHNQRDIPGTAQGINLDHGQVKSDDREGRSTKQHLYSIIKNATDLYELIHDDDDLPEWVQSKIAKSADKIADVCDYLDYNVNS
jgi:hypothetical protein